MLLNLNYCSTLPKCSTCTCNLRKINTLLNWSNKFKTLIEQSIILGYENHKIKVSIAGVIIYPEDTLKSLIRNLEQQLLISKRQNNNISIKEGQKTTLREL